MLPIFTLISCLPLKVKELRNSGDEVAREVAARGGDMSVVPPGKRGFEELMKLVSFMIV